MKNHIVHYFWRPPGWKPLAHSIHIIIIIYIIYYYLDKYLGLSFNVGSLSRPTTLSISSWAFFWTSGFRRRYRKPNPNDLLVVSDPAINMSMQIAKSCDSGSTTRRQSLRCINMYNILINNVYTCNNGRITLFSWKRVQYLPE